MLSWGAAGAEQAIAVGTPEWFAWLEGAASFAYQGAGGSFTARKEARQRGGWYWKAYRKLSGRLHRVYLGKAAELTPERLAAAATTLAAAGAPEARADGRPRARAADELPAPFAAALRSAPMAAQRGAAQAAGWPRGTVTFLFTDIVDSTLLWERYPQVMPQALVHHDALVHSAIGAYGGVVFKTLGDAVCAAFVRAPDALAAACAIQQSLGAEDWRRFGLPPERPLRVRMAIHTGMADPRHGDYVGPPLNRAARILSAGHGGQVLLSLAARELVADALPEGVSLRDLGTYQLRGLHGTGAGRPERLFLAASAGMSADVRPPIAPAAAAERAPADARPLLATKFAAPRPGLAPRPRLIARLSQAAEHLLTLIVAPPGFGKTTLLADWLAAAKPARRPNAGDDAPMPFAARPFRAAWLTLDEADNDPVRFWAYLVAALEQQSPGIGADAAALLRAPQAVPIDTVLTVLSNAIAATPGTLALVLDDYHAITAAPIHQALATLLAYLPPNFHLVIASRADIALPLARLRARGEVAEIRAADLRCTPDEAAAFLRRLLGRDLARGDIATLLERTEGWMAGLQLAALSIQGEADAAGLIAAIRGDNRYIWDYLVDEVLERQPPAVRQFLLRTSLLERMCAELCDAVLAAGDAQPAAPHASQPMLEWLESSNLFVVPLDAERRWYRYHRLFADVLRLRVRQLYPELVAPIHRRAAAWYRRGGLTGEAIEHALAAQDWAEAAAIIEESAEALLMRGEVETFLGWARMLAADALSARPRLSLFYAAALVVIGQIDEADAYLRAAEQASAAADPPGDAARPSPAELATVKAIVAAGRDDFPTAIGSARLALAQLPQERVFWRLAATMCLSTSHWMRGDLNQLFQSTEDQLTLSGATGNTLLYAAAELQIAYIRIMQGKLRLATQTCWQMIEPPAERLGALSPFVGWATLWLSEVSYEWNDLDAAARFARDGIAQSQRVGNIEQQALNLAALALALQAQGDADGARAAMALAIQLARPLKQVGERALIARSQVRLWLAQGDLARAGAWARDGGLLLDYAPAYVHLWLIQQLALARVYVAQGGSVAAQAAGLLEKLPHDTEAHGQYGQTIEAHALLALAYQAADDAAGARESLYRALALTAPEGHIRLFVDLGAPMQQLLAECRARLAHRPRDEGGRLAGDALPYIDKVLGAFAGARPGDGRRIAAGQASHFGPPASTPPEALSVRELEVLRLIAAGQSNQAIARTLIIAESTVKMHLKNIYGKLGAHSRTQALARARTLGLL